MLSVSRETSFFKTSGFFNKITLPAKDGDKINNLTQDALFFLCLSLQESLTGEVVLCFKEDHRAYTFYEKAFSLEQRGFYFFPCKKNIARVPGFVTNRDRFRDEVLLSDKGTKNPIIITSTEALEDRFFPAKNTNLISSLELSLNKQIDIEDVINTLKSFGYSRTDTVFDPKTYSKRGDILDFYPPYFVFPVRCSFSFSDIDRISFFDPTTQISTNQMEKTTIKSTTVGSQVINNIDLMGFFSSGFLFLANKKDGLYSFEKRDGSGKNIDFGGSRFYFSSSTKSGRLSELKKNIEISGDRDFYLMGSSEQYNFDLPLPNVHNVSFLKAGRSFYSSLLDISFVSLIDVTKERLLVEKWNPPENKNISPIDRKGVSSLSHGDVLVHKRFGVGKYFGLTMKQTPSGQIEMLELVYKNNGRVFVSVENLDLIQKYIGSAKEPSISNLGSSKWDLEVKKARKSAQLVVKDLIEIYAKRKNPRSFRYVEDLELEGAISSSFPYQETPDQLKAISDVLSDMAGKHPVDRLVCGDVGFGKTEVALRAIVRAVVSKKACVFLCPTTILADQHFITCQERLGPLGINVSLLSRFKTKKEQLEITNLVGEGKVDLLVGTHRVLSPDVVFKNLGLLIIDEEHRFGVKHKEKIRSLKKDIDVLTLTATPIPRTLQQSAVGIRDISRIQTPPKSRKPILTEVRYFDWILIQEHINREILRSGQVYFVHNDISSISFIKDKILTFFPTKGVDYIHGQMESRLLESKVLAFFNGGIDILVCTSIIESGLDVSNANTIIINNAHRFGLSQLYQIRGRVGRSTRRASCLLLIPKKDLDQRSFKRLKTIEQYRSLGSGYDISMKDLEIRGAGSLFGHKQSGHITTIGFELYCDLLKEEVNTALNKNKENSYPDVTIEMGAYIPVSYVENENQRLGFYEKFSQAQSEKEVKEIKTELIDRFGKEPIETSNLFYLSLFRILYKNTSIKKLTVGELFVTFIFSGFLPFKTPEHMLYQLRSWAKGKQLSLLFKEADKETFSCSFNYKSKTNGFAEIVSFAKLF
tara:strand:+ start:1332 stop:4451 length:3120 start_codon:yes stop_codon:yes gene_type:complete